jgi:hypothetical protein
MWVLLAKICAVAIPIPAESNFTIPVDPIKHQNGKCEIMKKPLLLVAMAAAALPLAVVFAEDTVTPKATAETKDPNSSCIVMMGMNNGKMMGMSDMMSNWKEQDSELDKLVSAMNGASPDKKLDTIAAVVSKLVDQCKSAHEAMQKMMETTGKEMMSMCRMMMMQNNQENKEDDHSQHH